MECLWEAHWTGPECEGSEGHQRSVGWTNQYHTVYKTYKCCTGHLFMKTAWPVSKVPLTHTHINTTYGQWAHCTQISIGGSHATYIRTHTRTLSLTRGPSLQPCVQRVTCHPEVWFTELTLWPNPVGCSEPSCTEAGTSQRKYKWARLAAPAVQEKHIQQNEHSTQNMEFQNTLTL